MQGDWFWPAERTENKQFLVSILRTKCVVMKNQNFLFFCNRITVKSLYLVYYGLAQA